MIGLLIGKKGSGKTKKLISRANDALKASDGNVVVIEKGLKLTYEISHKVRLVDTEAYNIIGADSLFGFISGICAGNYDVTDILVDSTLKITGKDMNILEKFITDLSAVKDLEKVNFTLLISAGEEEIPENLAKYILA